MNKHHAQPLGPTRSRPGNYTPPVLAEIEALLTCTGELERQRDQAVAHHKEDLARLVIAERALGELVAGLDGLPAFIRGHMMMSPVLAGALDEARGLVEVLT